MRNTILIGDALTWLKRLPSESVHLIMTSPPYYDLRNYQVDGQIGLEETPEAYIENLVTIFREARRVLRSDGTFWLNMGDSYCGGGTHYGDKNPGLSQNKKRVGGEEWTNSPSGYKPKDLMNMPHRLVLALQQDGYWHRQTNIWHKPNSMPSSAQDRTTTDYEFVFHLSKAARYWYDQDAVREANTNKTIKRLQSGTIMAFHDSPYAQAVRGDHGGEYAVANGRNRRATWTIPTQPYPEAHFATYPVALAEIPILAGCPETVCAVCGAGWERVVDRQTNVYNLMEGQKQRIRANTMSGGVDHVTLGVTEFIQRRTLGFAPACTCNFDKLPPMPAQHWEFDWSKHLADHTEPGLVLDPFGGAGTTALAALNHGRDYILIELNPAYAGLAQRRIKAHRRKLQAADPTQPTELANGLKQLSLFGESA